MDYITLLQTLNNSVAEVRFLRRTPKPGMAPTRRMFCTLDMNLLESELGRSILNYKSAANPPKYDPAAKGLLCVWDIFMQDWRMVNVEGCSIISTVDSTNVETFWSFFKESILPMSAAAKAEFINT
jgi:hypothetical protein